MTTRLDHDAALDLSTDLLRPVAPHPGNAEHITSVLMHWIDVLGITTPPGCA